LKENAEYANYYSIIIVCVRISFSIILFRKTNVPQNPHFSENTIIYMEKISVTLKIHFLLNYKLY